MILVHTLGTALIDTSSCPIKPTSPRKFALLLHLSAERGRRIPRSTLQELRGPDRREERNGRHSARELVYQLRQLGVALDAGSDRRRAARRTRPGQGLRRDHAIGMLSAQSRFEPLPEGFCLAMYLPTRRPLFRVVRGISSALPIGALSRALLREVSRARNSGDWEATERAARACLALDPLNEEATLALAEMLALGGAKAKAIHLLDGYMEEVGRSQLGSQDPGENTSSTNQPGN